MKKNRLIYIVIDGLAFREGRDCMGFLQALCESGRATLYRLECALPSMSRPLYETLLTGKVPVESGIVNNDVVRLSREPSIFSLAAKSGLVTAAAAYHWFSELYNKAPYDAARDRHTHNPEMNIQHGCFYHSVNYCDEHLYLDAEHLRKSCSPDFLLIHPMGVDNAGHGFGRDSQQYRNAVRKSDFFLSALLIEWIEQGYQIVITADHGMNNDKSHGGNLAEEREVPLYVIGDAFSHDADVKPAQTELAGTVCHILGIDHDMPLFEGLLFRS